jgi:hypothetical protein
MFPLRLRSKSKLLLIVGYYSLSAAIYLALSLLSPTLWFLSLGLAVVSLAASYGLYSRKGWGWLLSGLSSLLGIVFWGISLYAFYMTVGNPLVENAPASADTILIIDLSLAMLVLLSIISLFHTYMSRNSFSEQS